MALFIEVTNIDGEQMFINMDSVECMYHAPGKEFTSICTQGHEDREMRVKETMPVLMARIKEAQQKWG
jgi:uncharacterized protein YlzI (FlbEa/FlbD family)